MIFCLRTDENFIIYLLVRKGGEVTVLIPDSYSPGYFVGQRPAVDHFPAEKECLQSEVFVMFSGMCQRLSGVTYYRASEEKGQTAEIPNCPKCMNVNVSLYKCL